MNLPYGATTFLPFRATLFWSVARGPDFLPTVTAFRREMAGIFAFYVVEPYPKAPVESAGKG